MDSVTQSNVPVVKLVIPSDTGAAPSKVVAIAQAQPELLKESRHQKVEMFLQAKSFADNTCRGYRRQLTAFIDWAGKDWELVSLADLTRYQKEMEGRSLKKASKAAALIAIKSMYSWMKQSGQLAVNPSDGITIPVIEVGESKHLELDEVTKLFGAVEGRKTALRDRAILLLWFNAGLRAEEVTKLNIGDYNSVEVTVREAKHGSSGAVPTDDETHDAMVAYLVQRTADNGGMLSDDDPLFVSRSHRSFGQRLSYEGVYKILKEIAAAAGLENVHPHRGRHTFSSNLLENEVDAYLAMPLMRQRSLKAFNTYNNKVRQKAARDAFWKAKGVKPRTASSVQQMVETWEQEQLETELPTVEGKTYPMPTMRQILKQEVTVRLKLKVEDRLLSGRNKAKVKRAIEAQIFARYRMVKPKSRGGEYELTIPFVKEDDISVAVAEILWEMDFLAELDDCFVSHEFTGVVL
jgi:integrase/recombinase XerD